MNLPAKLRQLASQENHDGEPYDSLIQAATELERENIELRQVVVKILAERDRLNGALQTLINLNAGQDEGGDGITGEDWEIASYAVISQP